MTDVNWRKVGIVAGVINLVVINVAVGWMLRELGRAKTDTGDWSEEGGVKTEDSCGEACMAQIERQVALIRSKIPETENEEDESTGTAAVTPTRSVMPAPVVTSTTTSKKVRTVAYVTIPGSGNSKSLTWENINGTEFYFDKSDYPGLKEIYFEANIQLVNGNGKAFVRLYDADHSIGVDGSEVTSTGQPAGIYTSGKLNFWAGRNLIRIQAKTLTADTAVYNYGRLKIITEN